VRIVVYGASGTTGALVAAELAARGAEVVLAGRDRARLSAVATRSGGWPAIAVAPAHDRAALVRAFTGAKVVIDCAGPFTRIGGAVLSAALAAGAHWIDVAREQSFLRATFEEHESAARHAGLAVIGGLGVEVGLGDWAARCAAAAVIAAPELGATTERIAGDPAVHEITIGYAVDDLAATPGTQRSVLASMTSPGLAWRSRRWDRARPGGRRRDVDFGPFGHRMARWFPAGEVVTVPRHVEVGTVDTYLAFGGAWSIYERAASLFALAAGAAAPMLDALLAPLVDPTHVPDAEARARTRFAVVAHARHGLERSQVTLVGTDVYATTARIVADAAVALAGRDGGPSGVLTPAQAFAAAPALHALADAGVLSIG
jgi:short subunit dehydrogenase-like uncharacterized protein